ncbi:hypothetical protein A2U01_0088984, partial [Trifolium medium]|nr:hypothetical protein [Trifolium medium]
VVNPAGSWWSGAERLLAAMGWLRAAQLALAAAIQVK